MFLGPDGHGVPLEVVGVESDEGDLEVFHVMKMQGRYIEDYLKEMECREQ